MSIEQTDKESAAVATHPRVSLDDIKRSIRETYYVMADRACSAAFDGAESTRPDGYADPLQIMTLCFLVLKNGFVIVGKSAPISPENFNLDLGKKFAYEDAIEQVWPLAAFALKETWYRQGHENNVGGIAG